MHALHVWWILGSCHPRSGPSFPHMYTSHTLVLTTCDHGTRAWHPSHTVCRAWRVRVSPISLARSKERGCVGGGGAPPRTRCTHSCPRNETIARDLSRLSYNTANGSQAGT